MRLSFRLFVMLCCLLASCHKKTACMIVQTVLPCLLEADELHTVDSTDAGVEREHTAKGKRD